MERWPELRWGRAVWFFWQSPQCVRQHSDSTSTCKRPTESAATWCGASSRFARSSTRTSLSRRSPTAFPSAGEFPPSLARTSCGAAYRSPTGSERCHPRARSSSGSAGRRVELAHAGSLTKRCTSSGRANRRVRPKAAVGRSLGHRPSRVRRSGLPSVLSTCHSPAAVLDYLAHAPLIRLLPAAAWNSHAHVICRLSPEGHQLRMGGRTEC